MMRVGKVEGWNVEPPAHSALTLGRGRGLGGCVRNDVADGEVNVDHLTEADMHVRAQL